MMMMEDHDAVKLINSIKSVRSPRYFDQLSFVHKKNHCKGYICYECDFESTTIQIMRNHLSKHNDGNQKSILCLFPDCKYSTHYISNMKNHVKTHYRIRDYKCDASDCEYNTSQSSNLKVHKKRKH